MKVYYEIPPMDVDPEVAEIAESEVTMLFEKWKYKTMWNLRTLEQDIKEEGGMLIVTQVGIQTKGFTQDLTERIHECLAKSE